MSSNRAGAELTMKIKKNKPIVYDPADPKKKIRKESDVDTGVGHPQTTTVKIALRIRTNQGLKAFKIFHPPHSTELILNDPPAGELAAILLQLKEVFGTAADEQWIVKYADYETGFGKKFTSILELDPFLVHENGLQLVPVVFTHKDRSFAADNYVFAISILPGLNNAGLPLGTALAESTKKSAKKKTAKKKSAKKKTAKKKRYK
jgi:hypothetical protein